jgi:hypothetical protein
MNGNDEHLSISLPDQKNYEIAYGLAFKLAAEKLSNLVNLEEQCRKSESFCRYEDASHDITLKYLNQSYIVSLPEINIKKQGSEEPVELRDKILILHYLTQAKGTPLSNKIISYQELKEGASYYPTFIKRAVKPLINYFGSDPDKLFDVSSEMGGTKADYGDASVTISAFSRVPIILGVWRGADDFPPNANILFDSTILDYLSAEDVNVLCQTIAWKLVANLK